MQIKKYKNIIGLCACEECRNRFVNGISITFNTKGGKIVKPPFNVRRFWLCEDHTWDMATELIEAGGRLEDAN